MGRGDDTDFSVAARGFAAGPKALRGQGQRYADQRYDRHHAKAIHEADEARLLVQLIVKHSLRVLRCVIVRKAEMLKGFAQGIHAGMEQRGAEIGALRKPVGMHVCAPLMDGGDEGDTETTAPVAREIGQAGPFVVLPRR